MAGEWIKMRTNLWDDPRVSNLCDLTGSGEAAVIGGLYWLWASSDEHTEDGFMPGLSLASIDRKTGIRGLGDALVSIGWISTIDGGVMLERFSEHNGKSAKNRAQTAKRVANFAANNVTNAPSVSDALGERYDCVSDALAREREEKRREEVNPTTISDEIVGVPDYAGNLPKAAPIKPDCPHQQIIALYHEILPMCPQVRDWTPARAQQLRARWNEDDSRQNLDYWRRFFEYVKSCGFLVGNQPNPQRRPFFADLEWLTKSANFTKIRERKYES